MALGDEQRQEYHSLFAAAMRPYSDVTPVTHANDTLATSRQAFLADVDERVPRRWRGIDFAGILDQVIAWSTALSDRVEVRVPGDQNTVSFGLPLSGEVLWAAYPRSEDGAKIVVLPQLFPRVSEQQRNTLLNGLQEVSPNLHIPPRGLLQVPMHALATDRPMHAFLALLQNALRIARDHRPAA